MEERRSYYLGDTVKPDGTNFAIFSRNATSVKLNIFRYEQDNEPSRTIILDPETDKIGDIWNVFVDGVKDGSFYTWQIDGPKEEFEGHRFDPTLHLLDPYARAYTPKRKTTFQKAVVMDDSFLRRRIKRPLVPMEETIIYEMHVSLFTKSKTSGVKFPGTYKGILEKLDHIKSLGVTTIELLPVYEFDDFAVGTNPVTGERLKNVWGYNPIGFFALTSKYFSGNQQLELDYKQQLEEFKELVDGIHEAGLEVILDVVYNHTAEGNEKGQVFNFKGMDNSIFYILESNKRYYANYSGTGNTLNCNHPVVKNLVINSLRYWYTEVGVDGFRFDLGAILGRDSNGQWIGSHYSLLNDIANDTILARAKITSEGWDAIGGYFLDDFPEKWAIWNGKFRDCVRSFVKGDTGVVSELVQRVTGSGDMFKYRGKTPLSSLNFVTAHDGFTMWDLVSYNQKYNGENGEDNRDGDNSNHSWNHGVEGETIDPVIINLRKKQIKNMVTLLMISQGVPMILMGDEIGKTQKGNNNTYCQDSAVNWLDWERAEKFQDLTHFFKNMINLRKSNKGLRIPEYRSTHGMVTIHGVKPNIPDLSYSSHSIAFMFEHEYENEVYAAFNSYFKELEFELPLAHGKQWYLVSDTGREGMQSFLETPELIKDGKYLLKSRSSIVAIAK